MTSKLFALVLALAQHSITMATVGYRDAYAHAEMLHARLQPGDAAKRKLLEKRLNE